LLATARTTFETLNVEADPQVMEVVRGLAETAARTLHEEGRDEEEEAIRAAEARLVYVLTTAGIRTENTEPDLDYLRAFPNRGTALEAAALVEFLDGICPIWPFCK
jgi:hypothetical protein